MYFNAFLFWHIFHSHALQLASKLNRKSIKLPRYFFRIQSTIYFFFNLLTLGFCPENFVTLGAVNFMTAHLLALSSNISSQLEYFAPHFEFFRPFTKLARVNALDADLRPFPYETCNCIANYTCTFIYRMGVSFALQPDEWETLTRTIIIRSRETHENGY